MTPNRSPLQATVFRLLPGSDLKSEFARLASDQQWRAASVVSAVGSLSKVALRFANRTETTTVEGKHEIISLSGTVSKDGIHLHMSVADSEGQMLGGHLMEGAIIFTTAEIVIAEMSALAFTREHCSISGFNELIVRASSADSR